MAESPEAGPGAPIARRGSRAYAFARRHPAAVDGAFALALLLIGVPHLIKEPPNHLLLGWALQIALLVPLIWRRRAPFAAFTVVAALAFAQWLGGVLLSTGDLAVLIALYSVAAHSTVRRLLVAAGVVEVGVALATDQWVPRVHLLKAFVLLSGMTTAAAVIGLNIRTRRAYLASLEDRAARLEKERDQQSRIVAAEERARIARDVHDIVTHSLSVMVALTDGAAYTLPTSPERAADAVSKASEIGRQAISEMQRVLDVLRQDAPSSARLRRPQPGLAQLDGLLTEVRAAGLPVEFVVTGQPPDMASGAELAIYRLVQEALTNVRKHTPPGTTARVRVGYTTADVEVEITDNGRPAVGVPSGPQRTGHGIAGMRERVAVYGGRFEAGPLQGGGWRVYARFEPAQLESTQ
ncbi:histidine kinase [Actinoallomurus purpureus]|uniref:sensor histidine kinase n=1 Tax=Actinoallomurus purpureus TaxID=478114 RepID=UPI0020927DDA|nr:histidine kinase [Actinoallomurus purpureus]MCO6003851.1 histidine kinase [Actinoallomurus purpureus]